MERRLVWLARSGECGADVDVDKYGLSHPRRMVGWVQADQIVQEPTRKIGCPAKFEG